MEFYKFNRTKVDLVEYVNDYLEQHDENTIEIMVGTDSQTRGRETIFCTVVAMYKPGHGAHCIFRKWKTPRFRKEEIDRRLMKEVEASIDVAEEIKYHCWENPKYIDVLIVCTSGIGTSELLKSKISQNLFINLTMVMLMK